MAFFKTEAHAAVASLSAPVRPTVLRTGGNLALAPADEPNPAHFAAF